MLGVSKRLKMYEIKLSEPWLVWIEHWPENQWVASSIPSQSTCLGCRPGPQQGAHERQLHIDVSLLLSLSLPLSKIIF